jgi:hypothetical protein
MLERKGKVFGNCLLELPHKDGQKWDSGILTAYGPEKCTVPAGTFNCIRVRSILRDYELYAPGIGMVEEYQNVAGVHVVLKSFTPGKERESPSTLLLLRHQHVPQSPQSAQIAH